MAVTEKRILRFPVYKRERSGLMCKILKELQGKTAQDLLNIYRISDEPPIDVDALLSNIGMSIVPIDFSPIEDEVKIPQGSILGATIAGGENLSVFYIVDATENRKRFTLAHEIAHCCLHTESLIDHHIEFRENQKALNGKEYEANIFAGELLIPERSLHKIYNRLLVPSLASLMKIFKVSAPVMIERLKYLDLQYLVDVEMEEV